ncbi:MAG: hypothetical protein JRI25_04585 [Deltaproteobacteria bacterium]|nr:hypothetical protein [Deltaproteobacteria bacterium]MBW2253856.1 hypothetical protein [Deltaproteobacteria bacterium]
MSAKDQPRDPQSYDLLAADDPEPTQEEMLIDLLDGDQAVPSLATPTPRMAKPRGGHMEELPIFSLLDHRFSPTPQERVRMGWTSPWAALFMALFAGIALGVGLGLGYALIP